MLILKTENDFYTSVVKALKEIDPEFENHNGLLVVGSHFPTEVDAKIEAIRNARWNHTPFLGICFGMQLAIVEYARNYVNISNATSEEIDPSGNCVITKLPELRVGIRPVEYDHRRSLESHWHNYAFNREQKDLREAMERDFHLSYSDGILEVMKMKGDDFFVGIQFHPEYQSSKKNPHPILREFLHACKSSTAA